MTIHSDVLCCLQETLGVETSILDSIPLVEVLSPARLPAFRTVLATRLVLHEEDISLDEATTVADLETSLQFCLNMVHMREQARILAHKRS
jgi:hypothetical protein